MSFPLAAWLSTGFDVLIAAILLTRPWSIGRARRTGNLISITFPCVIVALLAFCPLAIMKLCVLRIVGTNVFGLMRLAYFDLVVAVPLVAAIVLISNRWVWRVSRPMRILAALTILAGPIGLYASVVEPFRLRLETATLPLPPERAGHEPITVGLLADIQTDHVTDHEFAAVDLLMRQKPDLIVIPGDLWQGWLVEGLPTETDELRSLLSRLSAPGGVYFVPGNLESRWNPRLLFVGTPVHMLSNEIVRLQVRDRKVTLAGLDIADSRNRLRVLEDLESNIGQTDIRLVAGHVPDNVFQLRPNSRVDLLLAGHTHGGQIVLPFCGPPVIFSDVPQYVGAGGLHEMNGRRIYVSRGVGWERGQAPRVRFLCSPEVSLLTLATP